jgi:hypothetical protein
LHIKRTKLTLKKNEVRKTTIENVGAIKKGSIENTRAAKSRTRTRGM